MNTNNSADLRMNLSDEAKKLECERIIDKVLDVKITPKVAPPDYRRCLSEMANGKELDLPRYDNSATAEEQIIKTTAAAYANGNAPEIDVVEEMEEDLDLEKETKVWHLKRNHEFKYRLPYDQYTDVVEHTLDVSNTRKRLIYALSDLHIGGNWSDGMASKLESYFQTIMEKAKEEVAAVVLVGDILEMWLEKYHEVPLSNDQRVKYWKQLESCQVLINAVTKLVDDYNVKVFYVRGNHDQELSTSGKDISSLFNGRAIFAPCTMILRVKVSARDEVRIRFAHGHEWDIFNSYMLNKDRLIFDKPLGYYVSRAVATSESEEQGAGDLETLLIGLAKVLLNAIPHFLEDNIAGVLGSSRAQRKVLERLFQGAFQVDDLEPLLDAKCCVSENEFIRVRKLLDYPLFAVHSDVVGDKDVFHMIKAATGDYEVFLERSEEDVVVLAHTHSWDLQRYHNNRGNSAIYANTGCWTHNSDEYSAVILNPPTPSHAGSVSIDFGDN